MEGIRRSPVDMVNIPIMYKVLAPSQVGFLAGFLNHREYHCHGYIYLKCHVIWSGDSWMYPYQCTPMGNPYISPI